MYTAEFLNTLNPLIEVITPLPEKVTTKTKLSFIDKNYGEFSVRLSTYLKVPQSYHPLAIKERQKLAYSKINHESRISKAVDTRKKNDNFKRSESSKIKQRNTCIEKRIERYTEDKINSILPPGVSIKPDQIYPMEFNKEDSYIFIDSIYGEFQTSLRGLLDSGTSTHPIYQAKRRNKPLGASKKEFNSIELEIKEYLESIGVLDIEKFWLGKTGSEIDLFSPSTNIGIEYHGLYFHCEATPNNHKNRHLDKMNLVNDDSKTLLQVFEHEWKYRKQQVKSFLKSKFGKNTRKIYARKCNLKEVPKTEAKEFLEKYHILGEVSFKVAFGLYEGNELLCLISIAPHHRLGSKELMLNRFISKTDVSVVGGLSKLVKHSIEYFKQDIYTFIDLRWSDGSNWIKSGWELIRKNPPDYFYYHLNKGTVHSKQSFKNMKNELEYTKTNKLYRVWDCGKLKMRFKYK